MSDSAAGYRPGAAFPPPAWLRAMQRDGGFVRDGRFAAAEEPVATILAEQVTKQDPVEAAFAAGLAQGIADAERLAAEKAHGREKLGSALARLDEQSARTLSGKLRETVLALCESVIADAAVDTELLANRCDRALAVFDDPCGATIRLHPDDIAELSDQFLTGRTIKPDATLPRGQIRVEQQDGGVICGPEEWRRAIRLAVGAD